MINPFESIVGQTIGPHEIVEGALDCQVCYTTVHEALYFDDEQLLVWTCPEGHKSVIEGYHID